MMKRGRRTWRKFEKQILKMKNMLLRSKLKINSMISSGVLKELTDEEVK